MSVHLRGVKPKPQRDSEALTKAPPAPKHLAPEARAEWKRIMPGLIERGIITRSDLSGVEAYCTATGIVRVIAEKTGNTALPIPPYKLAGVQIRYMQIARQLAAEYGLTPTSRARVGGTKTEDEDDDVNPLTIGRNRCG